MPPARTQRCDVAARCSALVLPRKTSLNCTMPALVNSSVGSLPGTSGSSRTTSWPCSRKNPGMPGAARCSSSIAMAARMLNALSQRRCRLPRAGAWICSRSKPRYCRKAHLARPLLEVRRRPRPNFLRAHSRASASQSAPAPRAHLDRAVGNAALPSSARMRTGPLPWLMRDCTKLSAKR